jgi:hypothetical protein
MRRILLRLTSHLIRLPVKRLDTVIIKVYNHGILYNDFRNWLLLSVFVPYSFSLELVLEYFASCLL